MGKITATFRFATKSIAKLSICLRTTLLYCLSSMLCLSITGCASLDLESEFEPVTESEFNTVQKSSFSSATSLSGVTLDSLPETGDYPFDVHDKKIIRVDASLIDANTCSNREMILEPNTIYYLTGEVTFINCTNFKLFGSGKESTILFLSKDKETDSLISFHNGRDIIIKDIFLYGNGDQRPCPVLTGPAMPPALLTLWNVNNAVIESIHVQGAMSVGLATVGLDGGGIYNSHFAYNGRYMDKPDANLKMPRIYHFLNEGVNLNNNRNFTVKGNHIHHNTGTGLAFYNQGAAVTEKMIVEFNTIYNNGRIGSPSAGIGLDASDGEIRLCTFKNNNIYGNSVDGIMTYRKVVNNEFSNNLINFNSGKSKNGFGINLLAEAEGNYGSNNFGVGNSSGKNCNDRCHINNDIDFSAEFMSPASSQNDSASVEPAGGDNNHEGWEPADNDCLACTAGLGCDAACQNAGYGDGGYCEYPGSTDPSRCCTCDFNDSDADSALTEDPANNGCQRCTGGLGCDAAGGACETDCDTRGEYVCENGVQVCEPPAEECNGRDDNCNGQCDEGRAAGCRVGITRAFGTGGHIYSSQMADIDLNNFSIESQNYFYLYAQQGAGMRPVHLCEKEDGKFFLSSANACEIGRAPRRVIGYWASSPTCGSRPLYRLYKADIKNHFYTVSEAERDNAVTTHGYMIESIAGYVWSER